MFEGREISTDLLAVSAVCAGIYVVLRLTKQNGVKGNGKRYPPSLPVLSLFGAILRGGMSVLPDFFMKSAEKLGPIFSFKVGKRMVVVLNGYDTIFGAMVRQSETFADRGSVWTEENVINAERRGIAFTQYDERFRKYHKQVISILKEFGFGIERVTETRILQEVESMNVEILKQNGRPFDSKWTITFATANVVMSILFGKNFEQNSPKNHSALIKNASDCLESMDLTLNMAPVVRFLPVFRKKIDLLRLSSENLLKAIEVGIAMIKSSNSEPSFIGRFLEIEGSNYNHKDLLFVLRDLCLGGTETVSSTLQWAVVELANHPEVQDRFQRELDEMVPGDRLPSLDDKQRLIYSEAVILEVYRQHTIAPFFVLHAPLKDTKLLEYDIPKGCVIVPNGYSAHMDPKIWGDPENFRPERFLDKDNKIINSQKVIAFGLGKRSCIGEILGRQSTFLFMTSLCQRFTIRPPEGQSRISVTEVISLTTSPSHFEVRLIPRVKSI